MARLNFATRRNAEDNLELYPGLDDEGNIVPLEENGTEADPANFQLFVAAVTSKGQLVYTNQTAPNGPFNETWTRIGTDAYKPVMAAGTTLDGRVAIVAAEAKTGNVHYIAESPASGGGKDRWEAPVNLGLPKGVSAFAELVIVRGLDGLDNVFAVTPKNDKKSIWWIYRNPPVIVTRQVKVTPPGSSTPITVTVQETEPPAKPWSGWINLNGKLEGNLTSLGAASNADGRIVLSGVYFNGIPWVRQQTSDQPFAPEQWSDWVVPGAPEIEAVGDFTPVLDSEGTVSLFASTNDGLVRSRQTGPGALTWTAWSAPGLINDNVAGHAASIDADGHLYVAVLNYAQKGVKNFVYGTLQTDAAANQWTTWQMISLIGRAQRLALDYNADGSLTLFAFDSDKGALFALNQIGPDSTEWFLEWTAVGSGIKSFAVTRDLTPAAPARQAKPKKPGKSKASAKDAKKGAKKETKSKKGK